METYASLFPPSLSYPVHPAPVINALMAFILTFAITLIIVGLYKFPIQIRNLRNAVLFFLLATIAVASFAGSCDPVIKWNMGGHIADTPLAACAAWGAAQGSTSSPTISKVGEGQYSCRVGYYSGWVVTASQCPDGKASVNGKCDCLEVCNEGDTTKEGFYDFGEMAGVSSPNVSDSGLKVACDPSTKCLAFWTGSDISHTAIVDGKTHYFAKGQYQIDAKSCDTQKDKMSSIGTDLLPPDSCGPGKRMGQVNGRDICVNVGPPSPPATPGKSASIGPNGLDVPRNPAAPPLPPGCWQSAATGNDIYCLDTVKGVGVVGGTSGSPSSDKGSKEGGNSNTPGTTPSPETNPCGAPGQPQCNVKIDESGVDPSKGKLDTEKAAFSAAVDSVKAEFDKYKGGGVWGLSWSYQLPQGACNSVQIGAGKYVANLDVCTPLGYVRDLWAYVLYMMTGLYIWRSARDAMNAN